MSLLSMYLNMKCIFGYSLEWTRDKVNIKEAELFIWQVLVVKQIQDPDLHPSPWNTLFFHLLQLLPSPAPESQHVTNARSEIETRVSLLEMKGLTKTHTRIGIMCTFQVHKNIKTFNGGWAILETLDSSFLKKQVH